MDGSGSGASRVCDACKTPKLSSEFYRNSKGHYRKQCKECWKEKERDRKGKKTRQQRSAEFNSWRDRNRGKALIAVARGRAKLKGMEFSLDGHDRHIQDVIDAGACELTGIPFNLEGGKTWDSPSLDRIDSKKGYTPDNVRVVLYCVNVMANLWGENKIVEIADAIMSRRRDASANLQSRLESALKQRIDIQASPEYVLTWKHWDMSSGARICRLAARARRLSDSDSSGSLSGWTNPGATDGTKGPTHHHGRNLTLNGAAKLAGWPAPVAHDGRRQAGGMGSTQGQSLSRDAVLWLGGWRSGMASPETMDRNSRPLNEQVVNLVDSGATATSSSAGTATGAVLNPAHSRWLMGFPEWWDRASPGWDEWRGAQEAIESDGSRAMATPLAPPLPPSSSGPSSTPRGEG